MPILVDVEQQTPVWVKSRVGSVTGSRVPDIMIGTKKQVVSRENYLDEIVFERRTCTAYEHEQRKAMAWGLEIQTSAGAAYELDQRVFLQPGGYWRHDTIEWFGASPDYLVGDDGLIEIKCPFNPSHHKKYLDGAEVPEKYQWQMDAQMCVTGRQWCDFVSFDPRWPSNNQLFVKRFDRNQSRIQAVECEVRQFLKEVEEEVERLKSRK